MNQIEILELKNQNVKIKNWLHEFNCRMGMREERVIELEDRTTEMTHSVKGKGYSTINTYKLND